MKNNNVYSKYKLDDICSSSKSYEEKLEILNKQKENIEEISKYIEETEKKLENGYYLDEMEYREKSYKKQAIFDSICCAISVGVGVSSFYLMSDPNKWAQYLYYSSIGLGTIFLAEFINDLVNHNNYNFSVNSYKKRLK